ncbi:MAG: hypothetical protein K2N54_02130 [Helicobacter sp.]|nr:hypothetical protein [Helicobacter sp.]
MLSVQARWIASLTLAMTDSGILAMMRCFASLNMTMRIFGGAVSTALLMCD